MTSTSFTEHVPLPAIVPPTLDAPRGAPVATGAPGAPARATHDGVVARLLRVPLLGKLLGANALVAAVALLVATRLLRDVPSGDRLLAFVLGALLVAVVVNVALVAAALRPLRALTEAAARVRAGDRAARVAHSRLADRELVRLGDTINGLLDEIGTERARLREMAAEVIEAGDRERRRLAHELHDSTAQRVAAMVLHLGAAMQGADPALRARLAPAKSLGDEVVEELRTIAHLIHPRVLEDIGLGAALRTLAREMAPPGVVIDVGGDLEAPRLARDLESMLYRVAQEAVGNALRHGRARRIALSLLVDGARATLEIRDDGTGFDVAEQLRRQDGLGIFSMGKRMSHVHGHLDITSGAGQGTRVRASVPLDRAAQDDQS